ncbi:hypothetical protein K432DRAFT_387508 [Lepidopterella palustris CBS 459.81]|uniref:N-acetyltransferase domain-containing protein n=1 Tax=Lepidopterella palustris CBS 459.81 TaxID=1314670 RepID=A0A8E2J8H1_9PEZI|nr:hypothetical protein K432DRAFT_387508 [Lepidopterella palustris CBS 459.81]
MKVRPCKESDIPSLAALAVKSLDDDAMDEYFYPGRCKHPEAYRQAYEKQIKMFMAEPSSFIMVAATEPSDDTWSGETEIAGYCVWNREGESKEVKEKWWQKETLWRRLKRWLRHTYIAQALEAIRNPSTSLKRWWTFGTKDEQWFDLADADADDYWCVSEILVGPKFRRRGVGQQLLQWGFEQAKEEQICISLCASKAGEPLYVKTEFRHVGNWQWGPKPEMVCKLMRWDPPKKEVVTAALDVEMLGV